MNIEPIPYSKGIEKKIIEFINDANHSIIIAMAWFTNNKIKDCLIARKASKPFLTIEIIVATNLTNERYFFDYKDIFEKTGIIIKDNIDKKFIHHKFMVIDDLITVTGSYNYTNKANHNLENILVVHSKEVGSYYARIFKTLTNKDYIDENIVLLFQYPDFAQSIISTYYSFTKPEYVKFKNKIVLGDCFTHENGVFNEIKYSPGFIFNKGIKFEHPLPSSEFNLPVSKDVIKSWMENRNIGFIFSGYAERNSNFEGIENDLDESLTAVAENFKRKMERTYSSEQLHTFILNGIDIIIEDDLWLRNFEPFLNKDLIHRLMSTFQSVERETDSWT